MRAQKRAGMSRGRTAQSAPETRTNGNLEPVAILDICFIASEGIARLLLVSLCAKPPTAFPVAFHRQSVRRRRCRQLKMIT